MTNEIAKIDKNQIARIDEIVSQYNLAALGDAQAGHLATTLKMAEGIELLEQALTPAIMAKVMRLKGTRLGFRTDENPTHRDPHKRVTYDVAVVKSCVIEAMLMGLNVTGNEFNIISKNSYITKEGYTRLVREFPGLTDLDMTIGLAEFRDTGAKVKFSATWKLDGTVQSIDEEIPVRANKYMGADAILGKGERKGLARIYRKLTGSIHTNMMDGDIDDLKDIPEADATVRPAAGSEGDEKPAFEPGRHEPPKPEPPAAPMKDPEPEPEKEETPESNDGITKPQMKKLHAMFNDMGLTGRDARLDYVNSILRENEIKPITSSKQLTINSASIIIDHMEGGLPPAEEVPPPSTDDLFK